MLAIIPAKKNSSLKNKNIKLLNGKPLIYYTIKAALKCKKITRLIVSTDSKKIARLSEKLGAEVPFLRKNILCKNDTLATEVYLYILKELEKKEKIIIPSVVGLQPTSPLRIKDDIDNCINLFNNKKADSVISFCETKPIFWNRIIRKNKTFYTRLKYNIANRQLYRKSYIFNGAIYVLRRKLLLKKIMYTKNSLAHIMPIKRSIDIDTQFDFDIAENLLKKKL